MPKISVIIPVYNTAAYLPKCLDSVIKQSFTDIEIICVNDGSTDDSALILNGFARKDRRIKVIKQKNQGLSGARNTGLDEANGQWICFVDSDDYLPPKALEVLYDIARQTKCQIVASRSFLHSWNREDQLHVGRYSEWNGLKDFVCDPKIFSSACNKLYSAKLFCSQHFTKGMLFEDWPVMTILFGQVDRYATTNEPCYIYRQTNNSITRSTFSVKKVNSYIQGVEMVYNAYKGTAKLKYARKRMAVAIKMLVNKVYRSDNPALLRPLLTQIDHLLDRNILSKNDLSFKTRFRLWLLRRR